MNFDIVLAIFRKDLLSSIKNKNIWIIILTPLLLSMIFSSAITSTNDMVVSVALYDEGSNDNFIEHLKSIEKYDIIVVDSIEKSMEMINQGKVAAAIMIPKDFNNNIKDDVKPSLNIVVNPYDTKAIVFSQTYKDVIMNFVEVEYPVDISLETASTHSQSQFGVPTWILFVTVFVGISILPITLTVEKEKRTLDAIMVTPASEKEVVFGKSVFGLFLTVTMSLLVMYINGGFIGNLALVLLFIIIGSTAFTGLGLLISSYANSYSSASIISTIFMMPLLLLALLSDLSNEIATISHLVPSTYLLNGINDAMLNNAGITETYVELLVLIAFNMIVYFLAIRSIKNKRQMDN